MLAFVGLHIKLILIMLCSYGVILWEMLTREIPYKGFDKIAFLTGVPYRTCRLTIPDLCPENIRTVFESKYDLHICFSSYQHCRYFQNLTALLFMFIFY